MNYYAAREMKGEDGAATGKWHYTAKNDDVVLPVGYCADGCPGHDTADEDREHYRQYLLDHTNYETRHKWADPHRCAVCGKFTTRFVQIPDGITTYTLYPAHANRAGLDQAMPTIGDVISSF